MIKNDSGRKICPDIVINSLFHCCLGVTDVILGDLTKPNAFIGFNTLNLGENIAFTCNLFNVIIANPTDEPSITHSTF